jgi:hypothetical protein
LLVHSSGACGSPRGRLYQFAQIIKQRGIPGREFLPAATSSFRAASARASKAELVTS